jgi:hypothetical protein
MTRIFIVKDEGRERGSTIGDFAYEITNLNNLSWDVNTPVSPMPLPEESHKENILVKMEGNSAQMSVSWTLLADDVTHFGAFDSTNSTISNRFTADSDTRNVFKEMEEFKENFIPENIQDSYSIWFMSDDLNLTENQPEDGTIASMRFNVDGASPVVWNVTLTFLVGNVIAMFEADVPETPSKAIMTDESVTKTIKVLWKPYDGYASSSDATTITGVYFSYKKSGGAMWETVTPSMVGYVNGGSTEPYRLGCEDCTTALVEVTGLSGWNYRIITLPLNEVDGVPVSTNFRIKMSLSGSVTGESGVRHKLSAKTSTGNVVLAVT